MAFVQVRGRWSGTGPLRYDGLGLEVGWRMKHRARLWWWMYLKGGEDFYGLLIILDNLTLCLQELGFCDCGREYR